MRNGPRSLPPLALASRNSQLDHVEQPFAVTRADFQSNNPMSKNTSALSYAHSMLILIRP